MRSTSSLLPIFLAAVFAAGCVSLLMRPIDSRHIRPLAAASLHQIDVNLADANELTALPRIGPRLAERIIADRQSYGPFDDVQSLTRVKGIGPKTAAKLEPWITFNTENAAEPPEWIPRSTPPQWFAVVEQQE